MARTTLYSLSLSSLILYRLTQLSNNITPSPCSSTRTYISQAHTHTHPVLLLAMLLRVNKYAPPPPLLLTCAHILAHTHTLHTDLHTCTMYTHAHVQLCAARQSEAHLQASLAGAQQRADASMLAAQETREAYRWGGSD